MLFSEIFDQFITQYKAASTPENQGLVTDFDPDWPSSCLQLHEGVSQGEEVNWSPTRRDDNAVLTNLNEALDINIPTSLEIFFTRYFSLDLNAVHPRGPVTLLQVYNEEDYERLQKNLIAHILMKRRLKQDDTLFFALTDEDDFIISVKLDTSEVVLEQVGKPKTEVLAPDLETFIAALKPSPQFVTL